eukprot:4007828-Pleurochrysis_carterae.AAC.7
MCASARNVCTRVRKYNNVIGRDPSVQLVWLLFNSLLRSGEGKSAPWSFSDNFIHGARRKTSENATSTLQAFVLMRRARGALAEHLTGACLICCRRCRHGKYAKRARTRIPFLCVDNLASS